MFQTRNWWFCHQRWGWTESIRIQHWKKSCNVTAWQSNSWIIWPDLCWGLKKKSVLNPRINHPNFGALGYSTHIWDDLTWVSNNTYPIKYHVHSFSLSCDLPVQIFNNPFFKLLECHFSGAGFHGISTDSVIQLWAVLINPHELGYGAPNSGYIYSLW